jgi:hypothetical protein
MYWLHCILIEVTLGLYVLVTLYRDPSEAPASLYVPVTLFIEQSEVPVGLYIHCVHVMIYGAGYN